MNEIQKLSCLKTYADDFLSEFPVLNYNWDENEESWELTIFKCNDEGYDITIAISVQEIIVFTELGLHEHFDSPEDITLHIESAFGLVRDMLSKNMRIKEYLSNSKPYRWDAQSFQNGNWVTEGSTALAFWNYFGKKTERNYVNDILEPREIMHFE